METATSREATLAFPHCDRPVSALNNMRSLGLAPNTMGALELKHLSRLTWRGDFKRQLI